MNKALIDTDIFSEMTKGVDLIVSTRAEAYRREYALYTISSITVMEMIRGYYKKQALRQMRTFQNAILGVEVIEFDKTSADTAGIISGELERSGRSIGIADSMIASIALTHGLELVTGNTSHFERIRSLGYSLNVVNWRT